MARTILMLGTRKGAFLLESDADRRDWKLRGPYCEGWPVYHVVRDAVTGAIYAAAASEWHGSAVWRTTDLGETWTHSSEGLAYDESSDKKMSKVSTLAARNGRVLVGVEMPGIFTSTNGGDTFSLLSTLEGQPGSEMWDDPESQPPGHLGISGFILDDEDDARFWAVVQGIGMFETADGGSSWTPRNRGLRADWPREHEEVGFCVHKPVRSLADPQRMYQQNHVGMHRSDDGGHSWTEITEGLPTEFGFAAAAHPHDRETFYVIPLDPQHSRTMPDGHASVWRTRDAGSSWQRLDNGLPKSEAYVGVLRQGMVADTYDTPGVYFGTSTGQVFASNDEGDSWNEIANYLPPISSVDVAIID
ncbi:MAG TPA: hypothetical protein VFW85_06045 [Gaiellaceae bacterium]|nr:hypothetical protein [Gaiellaceae bacterium]